MGFIHVQFHWVSATAASALHPSRLAHRISINPPLPLPTVNTNTSKMACGTSSLVNRNGPGSAATSIAESILKPAEATGTKTKCIECGDYECCCIPCTIL
ncbi:hypothetical protein CEP54_008346 [Fusarium duplospermum]|uniref:Uncharacterized protein n=1 Tax=Fusarium duplospermum TaxID=1325734 RepID=A0A428PWH6_9HYPO|nr:hypothetical protein CEP54_008346 [Fusarium duplospermum]